MSNRKSETVNPEGPVMADEAKVGGRCPMIPVFHHGPIPSFHCSSIPLFRSRDPEQRSTKETPYGVTTSGVQCAKQSQFGRPQMDANRGCGKWLRGQKADCAGAKTNPIFAPPGRRAGPVPPMTHYSSIPSFHHSIPEPRVSRAGEPACKTKPIFWRDK